MILTIDVPAAVQRALQERAERSGQKVTEFVAAYLSQLARLGGEVGPIEQQAEMAARLAALGRIGCYDTRARAGLPPLSAEGISRESIYEGRGL
jgi:hypothetical protein